MLSSAVAAHAGSDAIIAPGRESLRYADLGRQLTADFAFFRQHGFGPQSRIGVAMPAGPEVMVATLSAASFATCAPLADDLEVQVLEGLMNAMRLDGLIVPAGSRSNAVHAARSSGVTLIELSSPAAARAGEHELSCRARSAPAALDLPAMSDLAALWHTSGTTGIPKIVPCEQWRLCMGARLRAERRRASPADRFLMDAPPSSAVAFRSGLLPCLSAGAAVIAAGRLDGELLVTALEQLAPTHLHASPALHARLAEILSSRSTPLAHHLKAIFAGYAEVPRAVRSRLQAQLGVPMIVGYGSTETGVIAQTPSPPDTAPEGSVGRPLIDLIIADDDGNALPPGREGELCVRGPEVIAAYESPPEANREHFRDGWFRTGDCGRIDEDGFLFITGRIKDLINRGGMKVAPHEVESVLALHPAVRDVAVFGRHHPTLGEDVCALVVIRKPHSAAEIDLRRFARRHLASWKVPSRIITTEAIARSSAGKLVRADLRSEAERRARQEWQPACGQYEEAVASMFAQVLGVDDMGRRDNFFERGGDSLRAADVLGRAEALFGVAMDFEALLDHPDVAGFARAIQARAAEGSAAASGNGPKRTTGRLQ
jgi:acyl-CoA synthetase (AMP-forming)/AMP-acid ligase II/acyl carrier protein